MSEKIPKEEYPNFKEVLTSEQLRLISDAVRVSELVPKIKNDDELNKILLDNQKLKGELIQDGFDPNIYLLWHKFIGSTGEYLITEFDTPDGKIANYIKNLDERIKGLEKIQKFDGFYDDENKVYEDLTNEQNYILSEINSIIKKASANVSGERTVENVKIKQDKIKSFIEEIEKKYDYKIGNYLLGSRLIHSSPDKSTKTTEFDTPNNDIENFIRELYK